MLTGYLKTSCHENLKIPRRILMTKIILSKEITSGGIRTKSILLKQGS